MLWYDTLSHDVLQHLVLCIRNATQPYTTLQGITVSQGVTTCYAASRCCTVSLHHTFLHHGTTLHPHVTAQTHTHTYNQLSSNNTATITQTNTYNTNMSQCTRFFYVAASFTRSTTKQGSKWLRRAEEVFFAAHTREIAPLPARSSARSRRGTSPTPPSPSIRPGDIARCLEKEKGVCKHAPVHARRLGALPASAQQNKRTAKRSRHDKPWCSSGAQCLPPCKDLPKRN